VSDKIISHYNGNRPFNHPALAADENGRIVYLFGSNNGDQANVQTYAGVLDEQCNVLADPMQHRISANNNNNEGAPHIDYNGGGKFTAGYLSQGAGDASIAVGLSLIGSAASPALSITYRQEVVAPANIGRPTILAISPTRSVFCAAKGDQRPPEDGVECALLNTTDGTVIWRELVAKTTPPAAPGITGGGYMNQPWLAMLEPAAAGTPPKVALSVIASTGEGRNKNKKGASRLDLYVLAPTDAGSGQLALKENAGFYQAHGTICGTKYGTAATRSLAIFEAPITGAGIASIKLAQLSAVAQSGSANGMQITLPATLAVSTGNSDSGYLSNQYGRNPNSQGRDFLHCIGDVPNPGFGAPNGFLPTVKSFISAPYSGRNPSEPKNALFLSLVPAETSVPITQPTPPAPLPPSTSDPTAGAPSSGTRPPSAWGCGVGATAASGVGELSLGVGCALGLACARRRRRG
jgi:hypothetical protein